ncbi:MAG TPA: response regulator transcription factor [Planctomycetota bacterium]|nr:response regulator transcription factor [Planctomycetota bacterium]
MKVLVADDDPDVLRALNVLLGGWKYEVVSASDGVRALGVLLDRHPPTLAILDSVMPGMSGPEVCRKARAALGSRPLHIILLTVLTRETEIEDGLGSGADDYMTKPFSVRELLARIRAGERVIRLQEDLSQRVGELEEALARVHALEGLLPICMYCKKVRDDHNYWQQVETYVGQRSGARFTHGICPECEAKHLDPQIWKMKHGEAPGP